MLNKWQKKFEALGFTVSRWRMPKGSGKTIFPAPYVILQKNIEKIQYADNKAYAVRERIAAILVANADDEASEKKITDMLFSESIGFEDANTWDYDLNVHVRVFTFTDTQKYSDDIIF